MKHLFQACVFFFCAFEIHAATFIVNTTNDTSDADLGDGICSDINGNCSLRAAIMQANFTNVIGTSNTIIVPAGIYKLTRPGDDDQDVLGDLDILQSMTIQGAGSALTIVDGNGAVTGDRVFQIFPTATAASLSGLAIRNGSKLANAFDEGGGLYWDGTGDSQIHLTDIIVENNSSHYGGGLFFNYESFGGAVILDRVIVRNNIATNGAGGGIAATFTDVPGFAMTNCQVYGNTAFQGGGLTLQGSEPPSGVQFVRVETTAIYSNTAVDGAGFDNGFFSTNPVAFLNCSFHHNTSSVLGGAIENGVNSTLAISNSTFYANSSGDGAGIYNTAGTVTLFNSTLSGNRATNGSGGAIYNGVSLLNRTGTLTLINCTIASNTAPNGFGGGVTNQSGTVNTSDTIIAGNMAQNAASGHDFAGTLTLPQYDLIGTNAGLTFNGLGFGSKFNVNPLLGPLRDNGGPTLTHALLPGSPAIDAGRSIGVTTDQRGAPRPIDNPAIPNSNPGDGSDIGAFEVGNPPRLSIQQSGNAAVLSWPYYYGGFSPQSAIDLGSGIWTTLPGAPSVSETNYIYTNSPITGTKFYRLISN